MPDFRVPDAGLSGVSWKNTPGSQFTQMKTQTFKRYVLIWTAMALVLYASVAASVELNTIAGKLEAFDASEDAAFHLPEKGRAPVIADSYDRLFAPLQTKAYLKAQSTEDVDRLFRAAYVALFYTYEDRYLQDLRLDLRELEDRGHAQERHDAQVYESLIRLREFSAADAFAKSHHFAHDDLPTLDLSGSFDRRPAELVLSADGSAWQRRAIVLAPGPQIVVVGHPLCGFSQSATKFIENDRWLRDVFTSHSLWIMPQDGKLHTRVVADWNKSHPTSHMTYIFRQKDWPVIDAWATPNFYFFMNGQLTGRLTGWPPAGGVEALRAELEKIGLAH